MLSNKSIAIWHLLPSVCQKYALALTLIIWLYYEYFVVQYLLFFYDWLPLHSFLIYSLATIYGQIQVYGRHVLISFIC